MVGKFHQYPPVDLIDPSTHHIAKGQAVGTGQEVPLEVVSPNELKHLEAAGRKAAVEEAFQKIDFISPEEHALLGKAERKALIQHETQKIDLVSVNEAKAMQVAEMRALVQEECGKRDNDNKHQIRLPTPGDPNRSPSVTPAPGIGNWIQGVEPNPESGLGLDKLGNYRQVGMSLNKAIMVASDIKVEWDILDRAESYKADTKELAGIICAKLNRTLSEGKDSILKAVSDNNMDNAAALLDAVEKTMMVDAEGYSRYESL